MDRENAVPARKSTARKVAGGVLKTLLILIETVVLVVALLYGVMFVLAHGPSDTARNLFVLSVKETSAIGFLADMFFSEDEIAAMRSSGDEIYIEETNTNLVTIEKDKPVDPENTTGEDEWGLVDEDGDGIIVQEVRGGSFVGQMMVILDPTRVIMGCVPGSFDVRGYTVAEMVGYYDAVAGMNAGGFYDPNGTGNGSTPDSLVVFEGKTYYSGLGVRDGFVGIDDEYRLHVGKLSAQDIADANIQYGVCFGPALVINGEMAPEETLASGLNPRSAIGQRADGAILMLVIDGRQVISLGATYKDVAEIMLEYGAVQACNLDGGSSSLLWFGGDYINNCASVVGIRPVPTTWLVLKEGVNG